MIAEHPGSPQTGAPAPAPGPTLPRLLTAMGRSGQIAAMPLRDHRATYPPPPLAHRRPIDASIKAVEQSGLRGRGGAGFPTGRKMRTVADGHARPIVVVNGSEGEPASQKDELLLTRAPHLVLDGALHAAAAIGAREVVIAVERAKRGALDALDRAVEERVRAREQMPTVQIVDLPVKYVAGEETALVHYVNGGPAKPTLTPPRVFERGVGGHPTLVDNVETMAHVAQILRWGPAWFRGQGTQEDPGTRLVTMSGAVRRGGVYEVPVGVAVEQLVGTAEPTAPVGALLVGGYYGTWLAANDARRATFDDACLRPLGSAAGCGAIVVLPAGACGLRETARVLRWLAGETAGQCGPCVHGLAAIAGGMEELAAGRGTARTIEQLHRWAGQVERRGACSFPDGAVRLLRSALQVFRADVQVHLAHGTCTGAHGAPVAAIPATIPHTVEAAWR